MRHHHGLPDSLVLLQVCFDLSEFDPMPTNLHLEINPPKKVHITVAPVANKVAGPIKTRRARSRKRVFDESLCGQFQPVQVAAGDTLSANEQFAGDTGGNRLQVTIQHVEIRIGNGPAEMNVSPITIDSRGRLPNGRLRRSVHIVDFASNYLL